MATEKRLRLYIEFPSLVPGLQVGEPCAVAKGHSGNLWERIVVASDAFSPSLEKLSLLDFHDGRYVPINAANADLVLARVAGFDKAVYGLPAERVNPILFQAPEEEVLVSTTKLSQFITGRYEPVKSWGIVWTWILGWLNPTAPVRLGEFEPVVRPSFGPREEIGSAAQGQLKPPQSNERYGTSEAPLIQKNGDPCAISSPPQTLPPSDCTRRLPRLEIRSIVVLASPGEGANSITRKWRFCDDSRTQGINRLRNTFCNAAGCSPGGAGQGTR